MRQDFFDGQWYRWKDEDGRRYRVHVSLDEQAIHDRNQSLQADGGCRTLSFGRGVFRMSQAEYAVLKKLHPGLVQGDQKERERIWAKISRDPDYRKIQIGKW